MKRQILILALLLAVFAGLAVKFFLRPNPHNSALTARELATRRLAEYLARKHPGQRALIVSNPFVTRAQTAREIVETEEAGIRGLRKGFGKSVGVGAVAYPELSPDAMANPRSLLGDAETTTPLSYLVAPDAFGKLAGQHADCEIIVSLIGLPEAFDQSEVWKKEGAPQFAFLFPDFRVLGSGSAARAALKSGKLAVFVARKPGGVVDSVPAKGDDQSEFDSRFLLVTGENADQLARQYPNLF